MVIGNGMIANAFRQYDDNDKIVIFASGVSNSKETDEKEFEREFKLLDSSRIIDGRRLVYFSTCSIYDLSLQDSPYIIHKKNMEEHIRKNFLDHIILRLPNVIGKSNNKNTFFNYLNNKIESREKITIEAKSTRYLMDIDDLTFFLPGLIEEGIPAYSRKTINIAFNNKMSVSYIVEIMEKELGKKTEKEFINSGCDYDLENEYFIEYLKKYSVENFYDYNFNILKKYLI